MSTPRATLSKLDGCMSHLDGWVVLIDEVVLDELDGEGALAHASCADHHQLVLGHAWGESGVSGYIAI